MRKTNKKKKCADADSYQFEKSTPNSGAAASAWFNRPISPLLAQTSVRTASKKREFANFKGRINTGTGNPVASSLLVSSLPGISLLLHHFAGFPPSPSPILLSALQRISVFYSTLRSRAWIGSRGDSFRPLFKIKPPSRAIDGRTAQCQHIGEAFYADCDLVRPQWITIQTSCCTSESALLALWFKIFFVQKNGKFFEYKWPFALKTHRTQTRIDLVASYFDIEFNAITGRLCLQENKRKQRWWGTSSVKNLL